MASWGFVPRPSPVVSKAALPSPLLSQAKQKNKDYSFLRVMCVKTASPVVSGTVNKAKEI